MIAVTDCRIDTEALTELFRRGFENISLPPFKVLPDGIASHPDMLLFVCKNILLAHIDYYKYVKFDIDKIISKSGLKLCLTNEKIEGSYPNDVLFNAAVVGKYLIADFKTVSVKVRQIGEENGLVPINVNQGYTKCSICVVGDNAVITSDEGIFNTLTNNCELDILKIEKGHIRLTGYDYGFIGGASGNFGNCVYFCGDVYSHPDGEKIVEFCKKHRKTAVSLSKNRLSDVGTLFFLE